MILNLGGDVLSGSWMSFVSLHHVVLKVEELHLVVEVDDLLYSPFPFTFIMINGNISSSSEHFRAPFTIHYPGRTWACNVYPSTPVPQVPRRGSRRPRARSDISAVFTIAAQSSSHHGPVSWLDISSIVHNILPTTATTPTTTLRPERNVFTLHSEVYYGGDRHNCFHIDLYYNF